MSKKTKTYVALPLAKLPKDGEKPRNDGSSGCLRVLWHVAAMALLLLVVQPLAVAFGAEPPIADVIAVVVVLLVVVLPYGIRHWQASGRN